MTNPIETNNLSKSFGKVNAVVNLSLRVTEGEIYAFLGLNGAGKTTTIRMLLGMIKPTSGYATVWSKRIQVGDREPWKDVGYLVEVPKHYPELTVYENLEATRRLHPGTPSPAIKQVIEQLNLGAYENKRAGTLSHGNAQRLGLAKALIHRPKLIFLDEPANGLDPAGIVEIRSLLSEMARKDGVTIFMSSHILAEVSRLAQRVGIIHEGRLLQEMNIDELEKKRLRKLVIRTKDNPKAIHLLNHAGRIAENSVDGAISLTDPVSINSPETVNALLVGAGISVTGLMIEEEDLEQYFLRLVGENGGKSNG
jgi:ABC-2 type transport system ATP-binding protein